MPFYFYEDSRSTRTRGGTGYVRLHNARCGKCRRGVESQARSLTESTYTCWHGPYETYEQASAEAERTGLPVARCRECLPLETPA